jgi:hypothetical protein
MRPGGLRVHHGAAPRGGHHAGVRCGASRPVRPRPGLRLGARAGRRAVQRDAGQARLRGGGHLPAKRQVRGSPPRCPAAGESRRASDLERRSVRGRGRAATTRSDAARSQAGSSARSQAAAATPTADEWRAYSGTRTAHVWRRVPKRVSVREKRSVLPTQGQREPKTHAA